jgi:hypothetical protein
VQQQQQVGPSARADALLATVLHSGPALLHLARQCTPGEAAAVDDAVSDMLRSYGKLVCVSAGILRWTIR